MTERLLTKIIELVLTADRDLEPWCCDAICDAVKLVREEDVELLGALHSLVNSTEVRLAKLRLQVLGIILAKCANLSFHCLCNIVSNIEAHPIQAFGVLSHFVAYLGSRSGDLPELLAPRSTPSTDHVITKFTLDKCNAHKGDVLIVKILSAVEIYSTSSYYPARAAALKFTATFFEGLLPHAEECDMLIVLDELFVVGVLSEIYERGNRQAETLLFMRLRYKHLINSHADQIYQLSKIRAALSLQDSDVHINYADTAPYWKSFFVEIFEILEKDRKNDGKSDEMKSMIISQLLEANNFEILGCLLDLYKDPQIGSKFPEIIGVLYNDCSSRRELESAIRILEVLFDNNGAATSNIILKSRTCFHYSQCDIIDEQCFYSSFIDFVGVCSVENFAKLSSLITKMIKRICSTSLYGKLWDQLDKCWAKKLSHQSPGVKVVVLDILGALPTCCLSHDLTSRIYAMLLTEEDCDIRSGILQVLCHHLLVFDDKEFLNPQRIVQIMKSIENDDSGVVLIFLSSLILPVAIEQSKLVIIENIPKLFEIFPPSYSNHSDIFTPQKIPIMNVDDVIAKVCDSCSDAQILSRKPEKAGDEGSRGSSEFVPLLFRLLLCDSCDVVRMKTSIKIVNSIIKLVTESSSGSLPALLKFLNLHFFSKVESYNGPSMKDEVKELNLLLNGYKSFPVKEVDHQQNLKTVITLLESSPETHIVMDCY